VTSEITRRSPAVAGIGFVGWFVRLVSGLIWAYLHHFTAGVRRL
jgi:succinate dehydrogenase / fumarate reductase cytochrome b subunit